MSEGMPILPRSSELEGEVRLHQQWRRDKAVVDLIAAIFGVLFYGNIARSSKAKEENGNAPRGVNLFRAMGSRQKNRVVGEASLYPSVEQVRFNRHTVVTSYKRGGTEITVAQALLEADGR